MLTLLQPLWARVNLALGSQPVFALALGAALLALLLTVAVRADAAPESALAWAIWRRLRQLTWAATLVALLAGVAAIWVNYLERTEVEYRHDHGRVTEANRSAVRTIWGPEQQQSELSVALHWSEEQIERLESEDPTKPTVTRKHLLSHSVDENPFLRARHVVTLRQSPRKKGPAIYAGYSTDCRFAWRLRNPAPREVTATLRFPLPAAAAMYDNLAVRLNGTNMLDRLRVRNTGLELEHPLPAGAECDLEISFQSRGIESWYFQVREAREIRDLELQLALPDLPRKSLNYPEGCMTPTEITDTADGKGVTLVYRLDRALSTKGMGIQLPAPLQPGELTGAVLGEMRKGWVLLFAAVLLGLTLGGQRHAALLATFVGSGAAVATGLLANLSDTPLGFWGALGVIVVPVLVGLAVTLRRAGAGAGLMVEAAVCGLVYPILAGLDPERELLYLNLVTALFLVSAGGQFVRRMRRP